MIDSIAGILVVKRPTHAVIDVHGVRFLVHISLKTFESLPDSGVSISLLTYLHVREDILDLYGFDTEARRELFRMLIGISGIGPKLANTILSGAGTNEFKTRIIAGDVKSLTIIPGIGPKTAKRMIIELKEKFVKLDEDESLASLISDHQESDIIADAINALVSLGYSRGQAHQAFKKLEKSGGIPDTLEDLLKKVLSTLM